MRTYSVAGREVLDGYGADELCRSGRGQADPLAESPGGRSYEFGGRSHQVPVDDPAENDAIHGLVRWSPWTLGRREPASVVMEHLLHPRPGYPFSLALEIEYALSDNGLSVTTTATNVGSDPVPTDAVRTRTSRSARSGSTGSSCAPPAPRCCPPTSGASPTGRSSVQGTEYDFRRPRPIDSTRLDSCFADLERGDDGLAHVELDDPASGNALALWADDSYANLMLFTGPAAGRKPSQPGRRADDLPSERVP